jgi:xanthine dehydrogenase accessory factor
MMSREMQRIMKEALDEQRVTALITITSHPDTDYLGMKFLGWEDGHFYHDSLETEELSDRLRQLCQSLILKRKSKCIRFHSEGHEVECFVEVLMPSQRLIVAGGGHVCEPVVAMAALLGYHITVIDDRPDFATRDRFPLAHEVICASYMDFFQNCVLTGNTWILLLTRGHQFDVISLQELLKRDEKPAYIGMIGSRRRIAGVFEQLKEEFDGTCFDHIYTPVGLDIGAETPSEIAISILAEMLKIKNNKSGHSLSQDIRQLAKLGFRGGKSG